MSQTLQVEYQESKNIQRDKKQSRGKLQRVQGMQVAFSFSFKICYHILPSIIIMMVVSTLEASGGGRERKREDLEREIEGEEERERERERERIYRKREK